jgi:hypothetical protein
MAGTFSMPDQEALAAAHLIARQLFGLAGTERHQPPRKWRPSGFRQSGGFAKRIGGLPRRASGAYGVSFLTSVMASARRALKRQGSLRLMAVKPRR